MAGDTLAAGGFRASWGAIPVSQSKWDAIWQDESSKPKKPRKAKTREDKNVRPQP